MLHHWLLVTFSWLGAVRPQYINSGGPAGEYVLDTLNTNLQFPLPYYFNLLPIPNDFETTQNQQTSLDEAQADPQRRRSTAEQQDTREKRWLPNQLDIERNMYQQDQEQFGKNFEGTVDENATNFLDPKDKKYFSPWGGKRDKNSLEHMWTWKRASAIREPSMPKRVRFSPWGGKRSGQVVYKPGTKNSKVIFSNLPELTKIISKYSPGNGLERLNFAGFQFIPTLDKRHPIKILALSTNTNERTLRETLPFKSFLESLPKFFKPGHPYLDVNLKKDGKRKVKFSAWGGKRSPPIIGPIWTPAPQDLKETTLDSIIIIRNIQNKDEPTVKAL